MTWSIPNPVTPQPYSRGHSTELPVEMSSSLATWFCNGEQRTRAQIDKLFAVNEILVLSTRNGKQSLIFIGYQYGIHRQIRNEVG